MEENKKGITVKVDAELHAEVKRFIEENNMTMAEFVSRALENELHPKINETEVKSMEKMRTLAFQVPEEFFQKVKDYLRRNNISQKDFVVGLIENEIERDLAERAEKAAALKADNAEYETEEFDEETYDELEEDSDEVDELEEEAEDIEDEPDEDEFEEETEDEESDPEYDEDEDEEESEGFGLSM